MHHPSQLQSVLEEIRPYIVTLSFLSWPASIGLADESTRNLQVGLFLISEYMRLHGVDPDPNRLLQALLEVQVRQQKSQPIEGEAEHEASPVPVREINSDGRKDQ